MIDFVKLKVQNPDIAGIRANPQLDWSQLANEGTGEIKEYTAEVHGITLRITNGKYLDISGSLHKYWNTARGDGDQNYNDFPFPALVKTITDICDLFSLSPSACKLENLEYGVNIVLPFPVNDVLKAAILHRMKPFTTEYTTNKRFRTCIHQRYLIKIYNKGLQFSRPECILRYEHKVFKMEHLKKYDISYLSDLVQPDTLQQLGRELVDNFMEILFYGIDIRLEELPDRERLVLSEGRNHDFWIEMNKSNRETYKKRRERFISLVGQYTKYDIPEILRPLIRDKWMELLQMDPKSFPILPAQTFPLLTGGWNDNFPLINTSDKGLLRGKSTTPGTTLQDGDNQPGRIDPDKTVTDPQRNHSNKGSGRVIHREHMVPVVNVRTGNVLHLLNLTTGERQRIAS